jgi:hypothetical protein
MQRVIFCLTVLLSVLSTGGAIAQSGTSAGPALGLLEQKYFEHTYDSDSTEMRVARLERLIYGDTQKGTVSQRLASIVGLVARESETPVGAAPVSGGAKRPYAPALAAKPDNSMGSGTVSPRSTPPGGNAGNSNTSSVAGPGQGADDSGDYSNYPHITALENDVLGCSYPQDALPARLSRLETAAFGKSFPDKDLSSRTDALEQYAENKLHRKPFGVNPRMQDNSDEMLPDVRSAASSPLGVQSAPHQQHVDHPAVFADSPPPSSAQMLTRVGWCEYHLLGRTYPTMHLMARLRQLHDEVVPNKSETNLQLLDDMDALTNAVVERLQSQKSAR